MPTLRAIRGRIVDLRRYTNVHRYAHRPLGPTDRYELWIRSCDGVEHKFRVNTRLMPARQGHEVTLIVTAHDVPQVLGLANWSTIDGVNYARSDAPSLVRVCDILTLAMAFLVMAVVWGDVGMVLFAPLAVAYSLIVFIGRAMVRSQRARQVGRAIDAEAEYVSRHVRKP